MSDLVASAQQAIDHLELSQQRHCNVPACHCHLAKKPEMRDRATSPIVAFGVDDTDTDGTPSPPASPAALVAPAAPTAPTAPVVSKPRKRQHQGNGTEENPIIVDSETDYDSDIEVIFARVHRKKKLTSRKARKRFNPLQNDSPRTPPRRTPPRQSNSPTPPTIQQTPTPPTMEQLRERGLIMYFTLPDPEEGMIDGVCAPWMFGDNLEKSHGLPYVPEPVVAPTPDPDPEELFPWYF